MEYFSYFCAIAYYLLLGDAKNTRFMGASKSDLNSCERSFVNGTNDRGAYSKYWIAVMVQMNCERKVADKLNKLGISNYVPTQIAIRQWSDRKKKIERIVIPMVVFVRVDKQIEKTLRTYPFIYKCISYPGQNKAAIIPDEQIDNLKFMLNNSDSTVEISDCIYEVGEDMQIVRGPLKGFCGKLCYVEKGKPKIGICLESLGYAYVNVDMNDVRSRNK